MPVNEKRAREVTDIISGAFIGQPSPFRLTTLFRVVASLPEMRTGFWVDCDMEKPKNNELVYWWNPRTSGGVVRTRYYHCDDHEKHSGCKWQPCIEPEPPVEEESELVKELREKFKPTLMVDAVVEIVKRREQKAGAK